MDTNADTVEGSGHNVREDDCILNRPPEMKGVYFEHFKPVQDKLSLVLQHSRSHYRALAGRESFAGFLNVPLISDVLVKTIEAMFEAPKPCVLQLQTGEASANIDWLDVVKERNCQAEYKGNEIYHFHMRDRGVIVQLSAFQHNMILSGLPRKLVQPWSYERDVQTELNTLALTAEMVSRMNQLASQVIKTNNTVLEEILRRDRILRRNPEPSQRSGGSPFPLESAKEPATFTPVQVGPGSLDGMTVETQRTDVQASASKRSTGTRNFPKNRVWPGEVLEKLPLWFKGEVRKNLSQKEIARDFHRTFVQERTFSAIEAKVYSLTGKSPFRKQNKKASRKRPVSLTPRSSPPPSQPSESVDFTQQLISRSIIEVHALHLASNLLPYLNTEDCEDGSLYDLHGVQPVDPELESSDSHAVPEQDTANHMLRCRHAPQEHEIRSGTSQNEWPFRGSHQAEKSPNDHPVFSELVPESQPRNDNSVNVLAATSGMVDSCLPRSSPLEPPREPIQSLIRHPSEGDTTLEELGQTFIHRTESSPMHVEQTDTAHDNQLSERLSPQSSPRGNALARGSANEGSSLLPQNRYFLNPKYSDLTIICGEYAFPAHKAIICPPSGYFVRACRGGFEAGSGEVCLDAHEPILVRNVLEFLYKGKYTGGSGDSVQDFTDSLPYFHARMFAEAIDLEINELKVYAMELIFVSLRNDVNRQSIAYLIHEIYSNRVKYCEVREALLSFTLDELIDFPNWNWDWIVDPLESLLEFGRDMCLALVLRGKLDTLL
ncbi:hypothetical protein N7536_000095 [Penicillium majusculum]|nr:hypothetical protein N7536_000095 [Penicillium majusculum]